MRSRPKTNSIRYHSKPSSNSSQPRSFVAASSGFSLAASGLPQRHGQLRLVGRFTAFFAALASTSRSHHSSTAGPIKEFFDDSRVEDVKGDPPGAAVEVHCARPSTRQSAIQKPPMSFAGLIFKMSWSLRRITGRLSISTIGSETIADADRRRFVPFSPCLNWMVGWNLIFATTRQ